MNNNKVLKMTVHRLQQGMTIKEVADQVGVSSQFISYIELSKRNASKTTAQKIEKVLKQSMSFLLEEVVL